MVWWSGAAALSRHDSVSAGIGGEDLEAASLAIELKDVTVCLRYLSVLKDVDICLC